MRAKIGQCCTVSLNIAVESFLSDRCSICINKDGARYAPQSIAVFCSLLMRLWRVASVDIALNSFVVVH